MYGLNEHQRIELRRKLRSDMPLCEKLLWEKLRRNQLGSQCRRQMSIGRYIVDFCFWKEKLVIECDGVQHEENMEYDESRTKYLNDRGFKVLRYWNHEVVNNIQSVLDQIYFELKTPPITPPLKGAGDQTIL